MLGRNIQTLMPCCAQSLTIAAQEEPVPGLNAAMEIKGTTSGGFQLTVLSSLEKSEQHTTEVIESYCTSTYANGGNKIYQSY